MHQFFSVKPRAWLLTILCLLVVLTGCGNAGSNKTASETKEETTATAEISITVSWMRDLGSSNPHAYYPSQLFAQSMIYEPLVRYGKGGKIEPHLAQSWDISEDGKEYTFHLREDVKYSDGTPFNADSVKRNMDAILQNKSTHSWLGTAKLLEKVDKVDEFTVKLVFSEAYYPVLQDLTTIRPFRFLADAGFPQGDNTLEKIEAPIGTGPWILKEYKQDEYSVFVKNPNYWGEKPELDQVTVRIIPDAETRVFAFEKGELDLIFGEGSISLDAFTALKDSGKYNTELSGPLGTRNLILNTQNDKLADKSVRLALHHGFDKQRLVDEITSGVEQVASQVLTSDYPYVKDGLVSINYNVSEANRLLEEAGWVLPAGSDVREKNGDRLEFKLMYDTTDRIQKSMGEALQAEWSQLGVKLELVALELTEQTKRFRAGDYDMNFWFNSGVPYDPHTLVNAVAEPTFGVAEAHTNVENKIQLDEKIHRVLASVDEQQRQGLYDEIFNTIQDESVIIPLSYIRQFNVFNKRVAAVPFPDDRWEHPFNQIHLQ